MFSLAFLQLFHPLLRAKVSISILQANLSLPSCPLIAGGVRLNRVIAAQILKALASEANLQADFSDMAVQSEAISAATEVAAFSNLTGVAPQRNCVATMALSILLASLIDCTILSEPAALNPAPPAADVEAFQKAIVNWGWGAMLAARFRVNDSSDLPSSEARHWATMFAAMHHSFLEAAERNQLIDPSPSPEPDLPSSEESEKSPSTPGISVTQPSPPIPRRPPSLVSNLRTASFHTLRTIGISEAQVTPSTPTIESSREQFEEKSELAPAQSNTSDDASFWVSHGAWLPPSEESYTYDPEAWQKVTEKSPFLRGSGPLKSRAAHLWSLITAKRLKTVMADSLRAVDIVSASLDLSNKDCPGSTAVLQALFELSMQNASRAVHVAVMIIEALSGMSAYLSLTGHSRPTCDSASDTSHWALTDMDQLYATLPAPCQHLMITALDATTRALANV